MKENYPGSATAKWKSSYDKLFSTMKVAENSAKELLILSQAYIKVSKNCIKGTSKKKSKSFRMMCFGIML